MSHQASKHRSLRYSLLFAAWSAAAILIAACSAAPDSQAEASEASHPASAAQAQRRLMSEQIAVVGSVYASDHSLVSALVPGVIDALLVKEGDQVLAGESLLFRSEHEQLTRQRDIAQQALRVAEAVLATRQADLQRLGAERAHLQRSQQRIERSHQEGAMSQAALDQANSAQQQIEAAYQAGEAQLVLAQAQLDQASLSLALAQRQLADSEVYAPISGTVSEIFVQRGESASPGQPVLRIDDLDSLELRAHLPASLYQRIQVGETRVHADHQQESWPISYRAPVIDPNLRTFEVRAALPPGQAIAGQALHLQVILDQREVWAVPSQSLLQRRDSQVLFQVKEQRAHMARVQTGLRQDGWTELREGLNPELPVLIAGQDALEDGALLRLLDSPDESL